MVLRNFFLIVFFSALGFSPCLAGISQSSHKFPPEEERKYVLTLKPRAIEESEPVPEPLIKQLAVPPRTTVSGYFSKGIQRTFFSNLCKGFGFRCKIFPDDTNWKAPLLPINTSIIDNRLSPERTQDHVLLISIKSALYLYLSSIWPKEHQKLITPFIPFDYEGLKSRTIVPALNFEFAEYVLFAEPAQEEIFKRQLATLSFTVVQRLREKYKYFNQTLIAPRQPIIVIRQSHFRDNMPKIYELFTKHPDKLLLFDVDDILSTLIFRSAACTPIKNLAICNSTHTLEEIPNLFLLDNRPPPRESTPMLNLDLRCLGPCIKKLGQNFFQNISSALSTNRTYETHTTIFDLSTFIHVTSFPLDSSAMERKPYIIFFPPNYKTPSRIEEI